MSRDQKAYNQRYYQEHKEELLPKIRERVRGWQKDNKEHRNEQQREYRKQDAAPWRAATKRYRAKLKIEAVAAYGGQCQCCGETELEFLTLDHVHGGGARHRRETKNSPGWLVAKKEGYPPKYRLLCWNCNSSAFRGGGICVHQRRGCETTSNID